MSSIHPRRVLSLVLLSALSIAVGAACASGEDDVVRVYSARHYDLEEAFKQFNAETGTNVEFLFGSDAELRERIAAEGEDTLADVYLTVDAGNLATAAEQGVFAPLESEELASALPSRLRDPHGRWFGLAQRVRTIVYSPQRVDPAELSTYQDLADARWQDRLCLRQADSTYTQSLVASLIAADGEEQTFDIVSGWADNARIFSNDVEIIDNIASGACDVGIVNHYYLARELAENPDLPVALKWANQGADEGGVHVNISGGGVVAAGDNPDLAQELLEWLATDGQDAFVSANYEFPANPGVDPAPGLAAFGDYQGQQINAAAYGARNADAVQLLARAGYE